MERTRLFVRFVIFKGEVLAVSMRTSAGLRYDVRTCKYMRGCYAHVGQHGECYDGMQRRQRATLAERADLAAELRSIGYDLTIC